MPSTSSPIAAPSETAGLIVGEGLADLGLAVHHEWPRPGDRCAERPTSEEEEPRTVCSGSGSANTAPAASVTSKYRASTWSAHAGKGWRRRVLGTVLPLRCGSLGPTMPRRLADWR